MPSCHRADGVGERQAAFETVILDHPVHPLSLRVAYVRGTAASLRADFVREIVRIDVRERVPLTALEADCRVELQGLYFDFNQATLKPQSDRALREIATALRATPQGRFTIAGHTDNIGGDRYNEDLSARRAASVKAALVRDHGVDAARLSTMVSVRQPPRGNATCREALNRRVEQVAGDR